MIWTWMYMWSLENVKLKKTGSKSMINAACKKMSYIKIFFKCYYDFLDLDTK